MTVKEKYQKIQDQIILIDNNIISKLGDIMAHMSDLSEDWGEYDDIFTDFLSNKTYPFKEDFETVVSKVSRWRAKAQEQRKGLELKLMSTALIKPRLVLGEPAAMSPIMAFKRLDMDNAIEDYPESLDHILVYPCGNYIEAYLTQEATSVDTIKYDYNLTMYNMYWDTSDHQLTLHNLENILAYMNWAERPTTAIKQKSR